VPAAGPVVSMQFTAECSHSYVTTSHVVPLARQSQIANDDVASVFIIVVRFGSCMWPHETCYRRVWMP